MADEFEQERQRVEAEAQRERERIAKEALEAQERIRLQQSEAERQAEAIKAQAREAERIEQRKRDLPITRPSPLGTEQIIADIERQRVEAHREGEEVRAKIETEKAKAEAGIGERQAESLARIKKAEREYKRELAKAEAETEKEAEKARKAALARPSKEVFEEMVAKGDIPKEAIFKSYDPTTGEVTYQTPDTRTGKQIFDAMVKSKDIPKDATYISYDKTTGEIKYETPEIPVIIAPIPLTSGVAGGILFRDVEEGIAQFQVLQVSGDIPKDATYAGYNKTTGEVSYSTPSKAEDITEVKIDVPLAKGIWQNITSYLTKQFISPDMPDQKKLKVQYNKEQAAPLWSRLLFGTTVVKDPKTNEYYQIIASEPPLISPAGSGIRIARTAVQTIELDWMKFMSPKVIKPEINWNTVVKAIELGKIRNAEEVASWAAAQAKWFPKTNLTPGSLKYQQWMKGLTEKGLRDAAEAAARVRTAGAARAGTVALIPQPNVPVIQWKPFKPSELTVTRMRALIASWQAMKPSEAIRIMASANLVTFAVATNANAISSIISKASPSIQAKALSALSPTIRQAFQTKQLAKAQTLAQTQVQVAIQLQTLTQQAVKLAQKLATQGQTATQIKEAVQTKLQTQTKAITQTQVRTQVQPVISTITQIVVQTGTRPVQRITTTTPKKTPPKVTKVPPKITIIRPTITTPSGEKRPMTEKELEGAVAWKQGFIYIMIYPPYGKDNIEYSRKPFAGVRTTTGARSAYETLVRIGGKLPATIRRDMGIMDIQIITPLKGKPTIAFKADVKQRTRLTPRTRQSKLARMRARRARKPSAIGIYATR